MSGYYFLNEDKTYKPCTLEEHFSQIENLFKQGKKHVGKDIINGKLVSTVWLGVDHNHFGGHPLLFETMVFESEDVWVDIYCERYSTWDEAIAGHEKAIQWVLDGFKDEG